jgi:hypothetical protein
MNKKSLLNELIQKQEWAAITQNFTIDFLIHNLNYVNAMQVASDLFFNNFDDGTIQEFSVAMLFSIRKAFPEEWDKDWKNDVFLGQLCGLVWKYEEQYQFYKRAYEKLLDPPDCLLLLLADCNSMPGRPCISDEESEEFVKMAIKKKLTYEAALMMRSICRDKEDKISEDYWNKKMQELEQANIHTDVIAPDVFTRT